jgi:hypothetical protein
LKQPAAPVTLSAEAGKSLIAHGQQSNGPAAVAGRLEQILRTCLWLVFALQETKITVNRLRRLLFGTVLTPSPAPEDASAPIPAGGDEPDAVLPAEAGDAATPSGAVPPDASQRQERGTPTGGHRHGTGCLGAAAYVGAARVACRHAELAVGQRWPVCGQGNLSELPSGGERRIDGHALLSARRYALQKLRCSACGESFTAGLPAGVGEETYSAQARAVLAVRRYSLGGPGYRRQG